MENRADTWNLFLDSIKTENQITLVGPLYNQPHHATMPTVYVDGGANFRSPITTFPTISVGDRDSVAGHLELDLVLPSEKDYSDFSFVLSHLPVGIRYVKLLGFTGGRLDHQLANLGELHVFLGQRQTRTQVDFVEIEEGSVRVSGFTPGEWHYRINGTFSIFVMQTAQVEITGECRYQLKPFTELEAFGSHGLSNIGFGNIRVWSDKPCFVFINS